MPEVRVLVARADGRRPETLRHLPRGIGGTVRPATAAMEAGGPEPFGPDPRFAANR